MFQDPVLNWIGFALSLVTLLPFNRLKYKLNYKIWCRYSSIKNFKTKKTHFELETDLPVSVLAFLNQSFS